MRSYFGMTAHFLVSWCLQSVMLSCSRFRGSHTGDAIAEEFEKIITSFELSRKLGFTVSDSASNMLKAFSLPSFEEDEEDDDEDDEVDIDLREGDTSHTTEDNNLYSYISSQHVSCFAHVLQLVIKDGFKDAPAITKVLSKVSTVVSHVRKSIHSSELLESEKRLQTANATRWNSQLTMIRSVLRISKEKLDSLDTHKLTVYDRKTLEDLIEILTPFETATQCVQGDQVVTSSMIIPCVRVLKSTMETLSHKYTSRFVASLKTSVNKILTRYEDIDEFVLATTLDPRFKLKWCTPLE